MQLITNEYRKLNESLHNTNLAYGTSGHKYADAVLRLIGIYGTKDILDYGCGKCTLARSLPFEIKCYDPAIRMYADEPEPADILTCTDVLEHIEPDLLDNVLDDIRNKAKKVAYLVISTRPAKKVLEDGRNAHLIIRDSVWWFNKLSEKFNVLGFTKQEDNLEVIAKGKVHE